MKVKDAFDRWWEWASKPPDSLLTIPAELHQAVTALSPEDQRDRAKVNAAHACRGDRGPSALSMGMMLSFGAARNF